MPVEIHITENPGTLTVDCSDIVTVEDAHYMLERCLQAIRQQPAHVLFDCTDLRNLAPGVLNVLADFNDFLQHPNTLWLAIVTQNSLLERSLRLLLGEDDLEFFAHRDDADHFLRGLTD